MILQTNLQILPLTELEQGHTFLVLVSNAQSAVSLQFRHAGDPTWRTHPDFSSVTPVGTVVARAVICVSTDMRLSFANAPGGTYYVSCIPVATATF
jgi:hypothetical protein